jgi:magnesium chelatase subunit I
MASLRKIQGLLDKTTVLGIRSKENAGVTLSAAEFILEGLYAHRRISRSEDKGFVADDRKQSAPHKEDLRSPAKRPYN